jgi:c-di-GMP-related signal transduction protein
LPPMLRVPMHTILPALPFRDEVRDALAGHSRPERALLSWIEHIEENDVAGCEEIACRFNFDRDKLVDTYWHALGDTTVPLN